MVDAIGGQIEEIIVDVARRNDEHRGKRDPDAIDDGHALIGHVCAYDGGGAGHNGIAGTRETPP
jgi:hypothetical protein